MHSCLIRGLLIEAASGFFEPGRRFLSCRQTRGAYRVSAATAVRALGSLVESGVLEARERSGHVLARDGRERARLLLADFPAPELVQTARMGRVWEAVGGERSIGHRVAFIGNAPFDFEVVRRGILSGALPGDDPRTFGAGWPHATFLREMGRNFFEVDFYVDDGTGQGRQTLLDSMRGAQTAGAAVFLHEAGEKNRSLLEALRGQRMPTVVLLGDCQGLADASVDFNNLAAGHGMAHLLAGLGHRDILCVLPHSPPRRFLERLEGARRFVESRGGRRGAIRLREARLRADGSIPRSLGNLFGRKSGRPTAVLCAGIAFYGALDGLFRRCRLKVPRDVSVVGCGVPEWLNPAFHWLDLFHMDFGRIGEMGAKCLFQLIGQEAVPHTILVDMPHVPGRSLAPPRATGQGRSKAVQKNRRKRR